MPPRVVICDLCGGKFFPHSIEKHQKVCREKVGVQLHPCPYCGSGVSMLEMDKHILKCSEAKAAGAQPTGQSAALERRLNNNKVRQENGQPAGFAEADRAIGGGAGGDMPSEYGGDEDVRVECKICNRRFAFDRIAKHQAICQKLANKKPRKVFEAVRTYNEGGSGGAVIGVSAPPSKGRGGNKVPVGAQAGLASKPTPKPTKTHWREESKAFRDACRAAREYPMPGQATRGPPQGQRGRTPGSSGGRFGAGGGAGQNNLPKIAGGRGRTAPTGRQSPSPAPQQQQRQPQRRGVTPPPHGNRSEAPAPPPQRRGGRGGAVAPPATQQMRGGPPLPQWGSPGTRGWGRDCMTGPIGGGGGMSFSNETSAGNPLAMGRYTPTTGVGGPSADRRRRDPYA